MKQLTHSELQAKILTELKGVSFVSLRTETKASMNKGRGATSMIETINVDPEKIIKHTDIVGLIASGSVSYQDFVNNRLLKEAKGKGKEKAQLTFESGERKWGKHIEDSPALVDHTDKKGVYNKYLVLFCVANTKPKVNHTYTGDPINLTESRFDAFRPAPRKDGGNQGTDKPIIVRDYMMKNVKEITIFGDTYKVVPDPQ